jgi:hypothetical protein
LERAHHEQAAGGGPVSVTPVLEAARVELNNRCNAIEECYEYMLAYAAQGLAADQATSQIRDFLTKCDAALTGLSTFIEGFVAQLSPASMAPYTAFLAVIERDARDAQAAVQLVLAQPGISSQLVDNLNASIHLRALLTDLFLVDEVLRVHRRA